MAHRTVSNSQDIIDSRDIIERLEELRDERTDLVTELDECKEQLEDTADASDEERDHLAATCKEAIALAETALTDWDEDNGDELKAMEALNDEGEQNAGEWSDGATLVRESYFVEFCEQDVADLGYLPKDAPWWLVIDWEATANHLRQDYSEVIFDGETYLVRS